MNITEARAELARLEAEIEAARKRVAELEREPLQLWVNVTDLSWGPAYVAYPSAEEVSSIRVNGIPPTRIAVPMVELRPGWVLVKESVRITQEHIQGANTRWYKTGTLYAVMEYALSLAGVGAESQS